MTTVIVGYGNPLRGDDGVGARIAEIIETWKLSNVEAIALHQLMPELAEPLANADQAIFIDASWDVQPGSVRISSLTLSGELPAFGHSNTPAYLLALTHALYGRSPKAWWIQVGIEQIEFGERFSDRTQRAMEHLVESIYRDFTEHRSEPFTWAEALLCTN